MRLFLEFPTRFKCLILLFRITPPTSGCSIVFVACRAGLMNCQTTRSSKVERKAISPNPCLVSYQADGGISVLLGAVWLCLKAKRSMMYKVN